MSNPLTCRHYIIATSLDTNTNEAFVVCTSCDTVLAGGIIKNRRYEYDLTYGVWVHVSASRVERSQAREGATN